MKSQSKSYKDGRAISKGIISSKMKPQRNAMRKSITAIKQDIKRKLK